jgi:hypothetical protein
VHWPIGRPNASQCPSFRNQQLRFATRQVEHIADVVVRQVNAVEAFRELPDQANLHVQEASNCIIGSVDGVVTINNGWVGESGRDSDAAKARCLGGGAFDVLNRQRLWRRRGRSRVLRHIVSAVTMRDGGGASWCEAVVQTATLPP